MKMKKIRSARSKEKTEKRVSVNFTPTEYAHFLTMKEESGVPSLSLFIKARVFNETFRVIKVDRSLFDYYQKLTTLYGQFRSVGVNYNQTVVALKSNLTEKVKSYNSLVNFKRNGNIGNNFYCVLLFLNERKTGFHFTLGSLINLLHAITVS